MGGENIVVARYVLIVVLVEQVHFGSSTHNQGIGCLWKTFFQNVLLFLFLVLFLGTYWRARHWLSIWCVFLAFCFHKAKIFWYKKSTQHAYTRVTQTQSMHTTENVQKNNIPWYKESTQHNRGVPDIRPHFACAKIFWKPHSLLWLATLTFGQLEIHPSTWGLPNGQWSLKYLSEVSYS